MGIRTSSTLVCSILASASVISPCAHAQVTQQVQRDVPLDSTPRIALQDALDRAKRFGGEIQSANLLTRLAHEDSVQAKANLLPTLNAFNQFIYTEGNGTPSGVFVANDGVHIYNEQALVHQDLLDVFRRGELRRTRAAEAVAAAKRDVAARGLNLTVIQDFYAAVAADRKVTDAHTSLTDADHFLDITRKQESGGEAARADVIKAQLQQQQRQRDLGDAQVALEKAKIALAVFIFPDITRDFTTVDDLENTPSFTDAAAVESEAALTSPDLRAAQASVLETRSEVEVARYQFLPTFALDFAYGIDANQFTDRSGPTIDTGRSTLPHYEIPHRQNLGYSGQLTLNIPIWNWGATRSKVKQAQLREDQAKLDLSVAEKQLQANTETYVLEAQTSQAQLGSLRSGVDLGAESLRLTLLRYQAGEATVLEVVDAQTTLAAARNAMTEGLARYRLALGAIQSLTGRF